MQVLGALTLRIVENTHITYSWPSYPRFLHIWGSSVSEVLPPHIQPTADRVVVFTIEKSHEQMTNGYVKRCSTSIIIREMQIKVTIRYYPSPVRIAIIRKTRDNKCWQGCGEKGTLVQCWWECKLVQPPWKTVWSFLKKLKKRTVWSSNFTSGYLSKGNEISTL